MNEDNYLKDSIIQCVDFAMQQDDEAKRRIFTGLFEYTDRLVNEDIMVKALNDEEKRKWFDNEVFEVKDKEIEKLNNKINKAIEYIEKEFYWSHNTIELANKGIEYNLDKLLEILKGSDNE